MLMGLFIAAISESKTDPADVKYQESFENGVSSRKKFQQIPAGARLEGA